MNISAPQYSKTIATIKNRSIKGIKDIHTKLIFIYPFFCDVKFKDVLDSIRDFYTVVVLRDLYVNNALNFIKIASHISPLVDEEGNPVVPPSDFFGKYSQIHYAQLQQYNQELAKEQLKSTINRKILYIKRLVDVDSQFKQFRPHVEVVTLNNFIQVPVVVGTTGTYFDDFYMLLFLTVAVGTGSSLSDIADVKKCFGYLRNLSNGNISEVINNVFVSPTNSLQQNSRKKLLGRFFGYLSDKIGLTRLKAKHPAIAKLLSIFDDTDLSDSNFEYLEEQQNVLFDKRVEDLLDKYFSDTNAVAKFEKNFIDLLDRQYASSKLGYEFTDMDTVFTSSNSKIDSLYLRMTKLFSESIWSDIIYPILKSYSYSTYPYDYTKAAANISSLTAQHEAISSTKSKYLTDITYELQENICKLIYGGKTSFKDSVDNVLKSSSTSDVFESFKKLEPACNDIFDRHENLVSTIQKFVESKALTSFIFSYDEFLEFCRAFENLSAAFVPIINSILSDIKVFLPSTYIDTLINEINECVRDFLDKNDVQFLNNIPHTGIYMAINDKLKDPNLSESKAREAYRYFRKLFVESMTYIICYFYFYICRMILCSYLTTMKIKVETTNNDFLSFPNYSLVLDLNTISFLINAITVKRFSDFYKKDNITIDQKYLKMVKYYEDKNFVPIIGFFADVLNIPNLFVIDNDTKTMYYKLQNSSKTMKINLGSLNSYINQIKNVNNVMMGDI